MAARGAFSGVPPTAITMGVATSSPPRACRHANLGRDLPVPALRDPGARADPPVWPMNTALSARCVRPVEIPAIGERVFASPPARRARARHSRRATQTGSRRCAPGTPSGVRRCRRAGRRAGALVYPAMDSRPAEARRFRALISARVFYPHFSPPAGLPARAQPERVRDDGDGSSGLPIARACARPRVRKAFRAIATAALPASRLPHCRGTPLRTTLHRGAVCRIRTVPHLRFISPFPARASAAALTTARTPCCPAAVRRDGHQN